MSLNQNQEQIFCQFLQRELATGQELLKVVKQEQESLIEGDPEQIEAASNRKRQQVLELQQQVSERDRFLKQLALPTGRRGTSILVQQLAPESLAQKYWGELQQLAARLQKQNEINGGIMALGQRHVRQALELLTGQTGASLTYGPEGNHRPGRNTQSLLKA